jgi:hypothetical protein
VTSIELAGFCPPLRSTGSAGNVRKRWAVLKPSAQRSVTCLPRELGAEYAEQAPSKFDREFVPDTNITASVLVEMHMAQKDPRGLRDVKDAIGEHQPDS